MSLERLLNRINTSVTSSGRRAFLIFDEGKEQMIARLYGRLKVCNHVPSRYDLWEDGEKTQNIPIKHVIGGPAFRSSKDDYLLQMADFIAHALLKQEEAPVPRVENHGNCRSLLRPGRSPQQAGVATRSPGDRQEIVIARSLRRKTGCRVISFGTPFPALAQNR